MNRESGILTLSDDSGRFEHVSPRRTGYARWQSPAPRPAPLAHAPANSSAARFRFTRETALMVALLLVIGVVAAYDVYLSVKYQDSLRYQELNPIGRLLMAVDNGNVAIFMGAKVLGTLIVIGTVQMLYLYKRHVALAVASALAVIQLLVAAYLTLA
jgi:hypothetical protein